MERSNYIFLPNLSFEYPDLDPAENIAKVDCADSC